VENTVRKGKGLVKGAQWTGIFHGIEVQESIGPERDQQNYKRNQNV
jgi:hypothetical protein